MNLVLDIKGPKHNVYDGVMLPRVEPTTTETESSRRAMARQVGYKHMFPEWDECIKRGVTVTMLISTFSEALENHPFNTDMRKESNQRRKKQKDKVSDVV